MAIPVLRTVFGTLLLISPALGKEPAILDYVAPEAKSAVKTILDDPTLTTTATEPTLPVSVGLYDWLLDHPERASAAWQQMGYPCVPIERGRDGKFLWKDDSGSNLHWRTVARFRDGIVWHAEGEMKRGALMPVVPVSAVVVLHAPRTAEPTETITPTIRVFLRTESRTAIAILKLLGPAVPRLAEQGAEQMLLFFSGPARYVQKYPERTAELLAGKGK